MATYTVTTISHASGNVDLVTAATAVSSSDKFANTGNEQVFIYNGNAGSLVVTETYGTGGTIDGQTLPNKTKTITTLKSAILGPYPPGLYNDANGFMVLAFDTTSSVKALPFLRGS
jgi:hypothetical protein